MSLIIAASVQAQIFTSTIVVFNGLVLDCGGRCWDRRVVDGEISLCLGRC